MALPLPHRLSLGVGALYIGDQFAIDPDSGDLTTLAARGLPALGGVGAGGGVPGPVFDKASSLWRTSPTLKG